MDYWTRLHIPCALLTSAAEAATADFAICFTSTSSSACFGCKCRMSLIWSCACTLVADIAYKIHLYILFRSCSPHIHTYDTHAHTQRQPPVTCTILFGMRVDDVDDNVENTNVDRRPATSKRLTDGICEMDCAEFVPTCVYDTPYNIYV